MKPIITINGLSKQYRIGATRRAHTTLRDALAATMRAREASEALK